VFAAKSFQYRGRVDVDRRHDRLFHRENPSQGFPAVIDLLDGRHVCHRTACGHVRKDDRLFGAAQDICRLGHEMHAAKNDVGPL
jgi:hypothetical protein